MRIPFPSVPVWILHLFSVFGMIATAQADPISIDTSLGNGADTYVRLGQATTNFGGDGGVVIKNSGGGSTTRKGYVRLDVSGLDGSYVTGATLDFVTSTNDPGGGGSTPQTWTVNVYGLADGDPGENWNEGTIDWNTAPANGGGNNIASNAELLGQFTVPANATPDTVSFSNMNLSNFLANDTDGNATFILQRVEGGSGNLAFATKESASTPVTLTGNAVAATRTNITTADGNGADTFVQLGNATANFGAGNDMVIKDSGGGGTTRKGYTRFDLSGLTDADILGANLQLQTSINNEGGGGNTPQSFNVDVYGLNDGVAGENWDESTINFNNAPGNAGGNNLDGSLTTFLGSFTVPANAVPDEINFGTQELVDFLAADTDDLATLIFIRDGGNGGFNLGFSTKESGGLAPTLSVFQEAVVPEPASLFAWLIGLTAIGLTRSLRRRARQN